MKKIKIILSKLKIENHSNSVNRCPPPKVVDLINQILDEKCIAKIFQWLPAFEILKMELGNFKIIFKSQKSLCLLFSVNFFLTTIHKIK